MTSEENKRLVRRQFDEIWNAGEWDSVEELFSPSYINHDPYNPNQGTGPESFQARVSGYRNVLHASTSGSSGRLPRVTWSKPISP
jgi:predicted SnoaL-like aldol condensation-catalyzing enzyme